eukprot:4570165-Amphidinium_carterae.1
MAARTLPQRKYTGGQACIFPGNTAADILAVTRRQKLPPPQRWTENLKNHKPIPLHSAQTKGKGESGSEKIANYFPSFSNVIVTEECMTVTGLDHCKSVPLPALLTRIIALCWFVKIIVLSLCQRCFAIA